MSTIEPDVIDGGSNMEGNSIYTLSVRVESLMSSCRVKSLTNLLSSVSRTATPASTLPTVSEISILTYDELSRTVEDIKTTSTT